MAASARHACHDISSTGLVGRRECSRRTERDGEVQLKPLGLVAHEAVPDRPKRGDATCSRRRISSGTCIDELFLVSFDAPIRPIQHPTFFHGPLPCLSSRSSSPRAEHARRAGADANCERDRDEDE